MSLKSIAALLFAKHATRQINKWASTPVQTQERVFKQLINTAKKKSDKLLTLAPPVPQLLWTCIHLSLNLTT